jgi:hypothetical protein
MPDLVATPDNLTTKRRNVSTVCPATKDVAAMVSRSRSETIRRTPTLAPNSPRESAVGVASPRERNQTDIASKSNVKQAVGPSRATPRPDQISPAASTNQSIAR